MVRSNALALCPASTAWGALIDLARRAPELPDAQAALELARSAVPVRNASTPRRRRASVPAGRLLEVVHGPRRGSPLLSPAPGAVPGLDHERQGVTVYRVHAAGTLEGRQLAEDARVIVGRRPARHGDWVAAVDGRSIRLCVAGGAGLSGVPEGARVLGVVEAIIGEGLRRRCA